MTEAVAEAVQTDTSVAPTRDEEMAAMQADYNRQADRFNGKQPEAEAQPEEVKPETPETPDPATEAIPEAKAQEAAPTPVDEALSKVAGEIRAETEERLKKVFNQLGNISQKLESIGKHTTVAQARTITADSMKKLRELGFDELATALAEDLNGAIAGGAQPQDISQITAEAVAKAQEESEKKALARAVEALERDHPDRVEIRSSPEYAAWLATMPESKRNRFLNSMSPEYVSEKLDEFKDWRAKQKPAQEKKPAPVEQDTSARLENAVTPTNGRASASPTRLPDEAGLWAGYNKGLKPLSRGK